MTNFTVRVELRDADSADYDNLYDRMSDNGFSKFITDDAGTRYQLPSAEYSYSSDSKTKREVRDLAYDIASKVNDDPAVLVTQSNGPRVWAGLEDA